MDKPEEAVDIDDGNPVVLADVAKAVSEMERLHLDDLHIGQRFTSASYVMDATKIKEFAAEYDPQPFHLDEGAAQASIFKGLAASGWHTAAVAMRLLVTGGLPLAGGVIGLGGEITWPKPTRPGDTLHVESEVVDITPSRSKPHQGIVTVRGTMLNQERKAVYVLTAKLLVPRRTSAG
jgi:acyl dehydratase